MMREIRIHGRGGQGNVTASELLAVAAFEDGKEAQAFPAFGSERMGSPVVAFTRYSDQKIRTRTQVEHPDYVIVQDPTLIGAVDVLGGVKDGGLVIVNSEQQPAELGLHTQARVLTVPAFKIAREVIGRPIPNSVLMGAFAAATGEISLEAIKRGCLRRWPGKIGARNADAAEKAYQFVKEATQR
jgi:pyruvate ferredoxin oxidoreductase gamma subunit